MAKNRNAKDIPKRTGEVKGYRKDTEESKGDVFTAAAVAVQWRCRMVKEVFCSKRCKDRSK